MNHDHLTLGNEMVKIINKFDFLGLSAFRYQSMASWDTLSMFILLNIFICLCLHYLSSLVRGFWIVVNAFCYFRKEAFSSNVASSADIRFELLCIMFNIGSLHSKLGVMDERVTSEGLKLACSHFQCAAWAFQVNISSKSRKFSILTFAWILVSGK